MSNIHPFELYKKFIGIRTHFTKPKFYYGSILKNLSYGQFSRSKNYPIYLDLSKKWSSELSSEIFVSNLLKDIKTSPHTLNSMQAVNIKNEWLKRIHNIDKIFTKDFKLLMNNNDIRDFDELKYIMKNVPMKKQKKANSVSVVLDICDNDDVDLFYSSLVYDISPESSLILNEIIHEKYGFNCLKNCYDNGLQPSSTYLKIYKYSRFMDFDLLYNKYKPIKELFKII